jgi:hypothetical protein
MQRKGVVQSRVTFKRTPIASSGQPAQAFIVIAHTHRDELFRASSCNAFSFSAAAAFCALCSASFCTPST